MIGQPDKAAGALLRPVERIPAFTGMTVFRFYFRGNEHILNRHPAPPEHRHSREGGNPLFARRAKASH